MTRKPYTQGRIYIGRLPKGVDLVPTISRIANEEGIKAGTIALYGIVSRVVVARFDPLTMMQTSVERDEPMEIATAGGTISQFKGRSIARISALLIPQDGMPFGGTLSTGSIVYACELVITELEGGTLSRDFDPGSGLALWKESTLLAEPPEMP